MLFETWLWFWSSSRYVPIWLDLPKTFKHKHSGTEQSLDSIRNKLLYKTIVVVRTSLPGVMITSETCSRCLWVFWCAISVTWTDMYISSNLWNYSKIAGVIIKGQVCIRYTYICTSIIGRSAYAMQEYLATYYAVTKCSNILLICFSGIK